jgi:hypothetical protein
MGHSLHEEDIPPHALRHIVDALGSSITTSRIQELIHQTAVEKFLFHGIKRGADVSAIFNEGIKPLTPEGKGGFWTTGWSIFLNNIDRPTTYDTTFFHYGHSRQHESDRLAMTIAVTNVGLIQTLSPIVYIPNATHIIRVHIPREMIHILRVEIINTPSLIHANHSFSRRYAQCAELEMLDLLERTVRHEFRPGGLSVVHPIIEI